MDSRIVVASFLLLGILSSGVALADVDGDGLGIATELQSGTDPLTADTDGDGLDDGQERELNSNPLRADTDDDGLPDAKEHELGTNPSDSDTDGDGLSDKRERQLDLDPTAADTDFDGLDDQQEVNGKTNPKKPDTDGDGLGDSGELEYGTDPTVVDTDSDGLSDGEGVAMGTDPTAADTDGDGLDDGTEIENGTDPTTEDTDGDGLSDGWEHEHESSPTRADTDGDELNDSEEYDVGTNPTTADTDGDGLTDGVEMNSDTLPGADPTVKDVYVEVDVIEGAEYDPSFAEIKDAYEEHGVNVHFVVSETDLSGSSTITMGSFSGEKGTYIHHYNENFDHLAEGYHYLLIAPDIEKVQTDGQDGARIVGLSLDGMMLIQSDSNRPTKAVVMHELGHSLGLDSDVFEGIDSDQYSMYEYKSSLNYNADEYIGYSEAEPFDEWAWLKKNMFTPGTAKLSAGR